MCMSDTEPDSSNAETILENSDRLLALARGLVGDRAAADDILQSTWLEFLSRPPRRADGAAAWLRKVVRHTAFKWRRGERRRRTREMALARDGRLLETPEIVAERSETLQQLARSVHELEEPYRSTVVQHYLDGRRLVDIAEALGISPATVRSRLRRGLERLRQRLVEADTRQRDRRALVFPYFVFPYLSRAERTSVSAGTAVSEATVLSTASCSPNLTYGALLMSKKWALSLSAAVLSFVGLGGGAWLYLAAGASVASPHSAVPAVAMVRVLEERLGRAESARRAAEMETTRERERRRGLEAEIASLRHQAEALARQAEANANRDDNDSSNDTPRADITGETEAAVLWLREALPEQFGDITAEELLFLRELDLSSLRLGDDEIDHLLEMPSLVRLRLGGGELTDEGLAALLGLPRLKFLDLRDTQIQGPGLVHLQGSSVETLHLSHTPITDEGLAHLPHVPTLRQIKLNQTAVTDTGLAALGMAPGLKHVELDGTTVTDAGLAELLEQVPGIERIEARGTGVGGEGEEALKSEHPNCEFVTDAGFGRDLNVRALYLRQQLLQARGRG